MNKIVSIFTIAIFIICGKAFSYDTLILAHYMGWFSDSANGYRLWANGHPDTPSIGLYNSHHKSLLTYHTLLALKCGINGFVINCNDTTDKYDFQTALLLSRVIQYWNSVDSVNYKFKFALSYDDQSRRDSLIPNLQFIRDSIIAGSSQYFRIGQKPILFIYNYPGRITAQTYQTIADTIFNSGAFIAWNESDSSVFQYVDACYSWVQADWDTVNGLQWGSSYLDGHIWRIDNWSSGLNSRLKLGIGGVWPGFDSRLSWGGNRFVLRQNGTVYDSTWLKYIENQKNFPIPWIYIETWNDFNEGSEIEPTKDYGYQYLVHTIKNVNTFRHSQLPSDTTAFSCAYQIYQAYNLIETGKRDSALHFQRIIAAVKNFLQNNYSLSNKYSDSVITNIFPARNRGTNNQHADYKTFRIFKNNIKISVNKNEIVSIKLFNLNGRCFYSGFWNSGMSDLHLPNPIAGVYLLKIKNGDKEIVKRLMLEK